MFGGDSEGHESDHGKGKSVSRGRTDGEGRKGAGAGRRDEGFVPGSHGGGPEDEDGHWPARNTEVMSSSQEERRGLGAPSELRFTLESCSVTPGACGRKPDTGRGPEAGTRGGAAWGGARALRALWKGAHEGPGWAGRRVAPGAGPGGVG